MSTISKRKHKCFDIEAYYGNENRTFRFGPKQIFSKADPFYFDQEVLGSAKQFELVWKLSQAKLNFSIYNPIFDNKKHWMNLIVVKVLRWVVFTSGLCQDTSFQPRSSTRMKRILGAAPALNPTPILNTNYFNSSHYLKLEWPEPALKFWKHLQ